MSSQRQKMLLFWFDTTGFFFQSDSVWAQNGKKLWVVTTKLAIVQKVTSKAKIDNSLFSNSIYLKFEANSATSQNIIALFL